MVRDGHPRATQPPPAPAVDMDHRLADLVDLGTLQALQDGFTDLTGVGTAIRDPSGERLTKASGEPQFCRYLQSIDSGSDACNLSHRELVAAAGGMAEPCRVECHAGLTMWGVPIRMDEQLLGIILIGSRPAATLVQLQIEQLTLRHQLDEDELRESADAMELWPERDMSVAVRFARRLADMIAQLCHQARELRQRVDELAAIYDVSSKLAGRSEVQDILDLSLHHLVEVMGLRAASVRLLEEDTGNLRIASVLNMSREYLEKGPLTLAQSQIDSEALRGTPVYVADIPNDPRTVYKDDARREGIVSALVVALTCRGKPIGVMRAYTDHPHRFNPFDISLMQAIAAQAASAIVNARLRNEARDAERLDRQVRLAADVQRRMIPANVPENVNYSFGCIYEPSSELGGDFYDFIRFRNGDIGIVIADVVGKGVPASLLMASTRAAVRLHAQRLRDPAAVMSEVNRWLCEDTRESEFVTAFYGVLSADGSTFTYCNAGHEPVILLRDGTISSLEDGGMVLGLEPTVRYEHAVQQLNPRDLLVLFTDGLVDAMNYEDDSYGRPRLEASLREHVELPTRFLAKQLLWDVRRYTGLAPIPDDITVVVVRREAAGS